MPSEWQRWKGIMKCYPFEEKRLAKWNPPFIVQPKYDGVRCRAVPLDNGGYILLSSEENIIYSVPHINDACRSQLPKWEFDGELYCHGMSFEEIVSITSRTVNIHPNHEAINYHIFDTVWIKDQATRTKFLNGLNYAPPLVRAPYWVCEDLDDIMRVYDKLINLGYEGIVVRNLDGTYERKRSLWVMKFKPKKEDNYEIIGYEEEYSISGTPKGRLGALVCRSGDGNSFKVGTGLDDGMREVLWKERESLQGKIARVQYQHLTSGKKVPRFPVFMEVVCLTK